MAQASLGAAQIRFDPTCNRCGAAVRLFGIEPHPTISRTDLHTYVCEQCDAMQTEIVPLRP
jgi:hypothetical protein